MLTDTHCHFEDERYDQDREQVIEDNLKELTFCVNVGTNLTDWERILDLSKKYDKIFVSLGVHPHHALETKSEDIEKKFESLANKKVVAIGECGFDYFFDNQDLQGRTEFEVKEAQRKLFETQIKLSQKNNLPLVLHTRDGLTEFDAYEDTIQILEETGVNRGVVHTFAADLNYAKRFLEKGFCLGLSGIVTFDKTGRLEQVIREAPLDRILLETDSPYLSPVPLRGQRNEPKNTIHIAKKIAEIKNMSLEEVLEVTEKNARNLFSISV